MGRTARGAGVQLLKDFLEMKAIKITYYGDESISRLPFLNHCDNCSESTSASGRK